MKFYFKLKEIGLAIVLMGLSGIVFADLDSSGSKAPEFTDPSGASMSFNYEEPGDDQASSGTCATNPSNGNNRNDSYMEEPMNEPEAEFASFTDDAQNRLGEAASPTNRNNMMRGSNLNYPSGDPPSAETNTTTPEIPANPTTPEPATLLIIGMSLAGFVPLVKRYRRKQTIR
ncbi:MAG: PEP-CTERM sorting domain-containing protein [Planctomycetaceae bacterium]|jgi:hypothetical protein|nr:PEP-CTERM sorting domain-containing protein [Planctomycetaceae bacterium]